ncbi:MAG: carboxypeptidase-like regulatory domain-containing protein [Cytophagales bacterium]|nr:MAG: carboxypeptidase-like regulatory domain-containing protein [Cytophagales bacterium]
MRNVVIYIQILVLTSTFFAFSSVFAQKTIITGKVTDTETGEPIPFANVHFKGSANNGTTTSFDGFFKLTTDLAPSDSLIASFVGYSTRAKFVEKNKTQVINFQLAPQVTTLQAVVISAKNYENPAWEILRNVMKNKERNDHRGLDAYSYESYNKTEIDIDNISEKFKKRKLIQKITALIDSAKSVAGEDGKPIIPVFISEALSDYYWQSNPEKRKEIVRKTNIQGIAVEENSIISQIVGTSFQQYNFYRNWLKILDKDFISPIADGWNGFYDYDLKDSTVTNGMKTYRLEFFPKRPQDLAFTGTMWITDSVYHFALRRIDVTIDKKANLNFIEKIKIQQELAPTEAGKAWLPSKTRVLVDVGEIKDDWAGVLAKSYISNKNFVINQVKEAKFFDENITVLEDATLKDKEFWEKNRHDSLSIAEKNVYQMIDTIRKLPIVRNYIEIADIAINGYKTVGKVDLGTYIFLYANNNIEGHRMRMGIRTNADFSRKVILSGYLAYGTLDQRFKYRVGFDYIVSRKPWTMIGFSSRYDIAQVAIQGSDFSSRSDALFASSVTWGTLVNRRPFMQQLNDFYVQTDIVKGFTQKITLSNQSFDPMFSFEYLQDGERQRSFVNTQITFESRISFKEQFVQRELSRAAINVRNTPVITLRYVIGIKGLLGSNFSYHKFIGNITQQMRLGALGRGTYSLTGVYIPTTLPYPLLEAHLGNQTWFYNQFSYNLMNFFEFVSDHALSLSYTHRFEGLLFNRLPLIKKLKWRLVATGKILYGGLRDENFNLIPNTAADGTPIKPFTGLGKEPYIEVGYGIENIFKFLRVDFIHRLTYIDKPNVNKFGIRLGAQFRL